MINNHPEDSWSFDNVDDILKIASYDDGSRKVELSKEERRAVIDVLQKHLLTSDVARQLVYDLVQRLMTL